MSKNRSASRPRGWLLSLFAAFVVLVSGLLAAPMSAYATEVVDEADEAPKLREVDPDALHWATDEAQSGSEDATDTALVDKVLGLLNDGSAARGVMPMAVAGTITGPSTGFGFPNYGLGFEWHFQIGSAVSHWLGAMKPGDQVEWCRNFDALAPAGPGSAVSLTPRPLSGNASVAEAQVTSNEQMGYIIDKWGGTDEPIFNAAVSTIVHLSYEEGGGVQYLSDFENTLNDTPIGRLILGWAKDMVAEAKANAGVPGVSGDMVVGENRQDFTIENLGVQQKPSNNWIGGIPVTVKITSGNGVFESAQVNGAVSADGLTWTGTTATSTLSLKGHSTANGDIKTTVQFSGVKMSSVQGFQRPNGTQDTVAFTESYRDPATNTEPEPVVRDFQPMLTSSVTNAGYGTVAAGTSVLKDELTVFADPNYAQPEWLGVLRTFPGTVGYEPLAVTFKGTAYQIDAPLTSPSDAVPAGAKKVAETTIVANGPGKYTAEAAYSGDSGYITWVWEVDKNNQPEIAESERYMIAGNWSDKFGLQDETTTIVDFQPMLTSSTEGAGSKIVAPGSTTLKDELTVFADPSYKWTEWLGVGSKLPSDAGYKPLPVKFKGTAYEVGQTPIGQSATVPAGAKKVAETTIVANGPGKYTAEAKYSGNPAFVTWVWEVDKADQPQLSKSELQMIHANWADAYGVDKEQSSVQWPGKIESNVKIHPTNDNTYLVDDVWVTHLPTTHPDFTGGFGFGADTKTIQQNLYFWAGKTMDEVTSLDGAELIGSVDIPAKNGFYPSVGGLDFKLNRDDDGKPTVGTYQFVHEFAGDDRVAAFTSQIPDANEMYEVLAEPQIGTTAVGLVDSMVPAVKDVTITDTVCYLNLTAGKEYELQGVLMDQATGKPLLVDGKEVTSSKKFTPESSEGCTDIEFTFNASGLEGTTTVVFEDLYQDGKVVATHADINDKGQSIDIPKVGTTAQGSVENMVGAFEDVTLTDTVCYEKITAGKEYELQGVLMDQATGKPLLVDGKEVTSSKKFTPESSEGCTDIEFTFNASGLEGTTTVVFEDLFVEGKKIATHADIRDEGQTVYIPKVGTTATGPDGGKEIAPDKQSVITDKVCYENLVSGKEYTISGVLMDKKTEKPLLVDGKEVTSSKTFTAKEAKGCEDLQFKFDSTGLAGKSLVVFEDLVREDITVATHADINDKGQTVKVVVKTPLAKTGAAGTGVLLALGFGALVGGGYLVLRRGHGRGKHTVGA